MRGSEISYASGSFGKALVTGALELTILFYLTELIGMPPAAAGTALFAAQILSAAMDALVGRAVDQLNRRPYRSRLFLILGAILVSGAFLTLYALPLLGMRNFRLAILLVLAARLGICLLEVPFNALLPRVSAETGTRTSIAIWKFAFSTVAILCLSSILHLVLANGDDELAPQRIFAFGALCGLLGPCSVLAAWWRVRGADRHVAKEQAGDVPTSGRTSLWNRSFLVLFAVMLLTPLTTQLFIKSLAYRAVYVIADPDSAGTLLTALMSGQVIGLFAWAHLSKRIAIMQATALSFALMALGFAGLCTAPIAGWSDTGSVIAAAVAGAGAAGGLSMIWSLAADCSEGVRSRSNLGQVSTAFGLLGLAGKTGSAVGSLVLGWALSFADIPPGTGAAKGMVGVVQAINSGIPMVIAASCAALLLIYRSPGGGRMQQQWHHSNLA